MIFDSKYYPKVMFLAITVISLLLLFNIVDIMEEAKVNYEYKIITGYSAINEKIDNSKTNPPIIKINDTNSSSSNKQEVYSTKSYAMYYGLIIGIIAALFITFSVLRSTVLNNIKREEEERKM